MSISTRKYRNVCAPIAYGATLQQLYDQWRFGCLFTDEDIRHVVALFNKQPQQSLWTRAYWINLRMLSTFLEQAEELGHASETDDLYIYNKPQPVVNAECKPARKFAASILDWCSAVGRWVHNHFLFPKHVHVRHG